jgi:hypothetical protein
MERLKPIHPREILLEEFMHPFELSITVTLEENVARWARLEAARKEMSVSRLLGGILKEAMLEKDGYQGTMCRALARKPFLKTDGRYFSREDVHVRRDPAALPPT